MLTRPHTSRVHSPTRQSSENSDIAPSGPSRHRERCRPSPGARTLALLSGAVRRTDGCPKPSARGFVRRLHGHAADTARLSGHCRPLRIDDLQIVASATSRQRDAGYDRVMTAVINTMTYLCPSHKTKRPLAPESQRRRSLRYCPSWTRTRTLLIQNVADQ